MNIGTVNMIARDHEARSTAPRLILPVSDRRRRARILAWRQRLSCGR
jgi:hypothetical protein